MERHGVATAGERRRLVVPALLGVIALAATTGWLVGMHLTARLDQRLVDLDVYRNAGRAALHGRDLYGFVGHGPQHLPFTYPPVAALLAIPVTWMSFDAAGAVWTAGEIVCTAVLCLVAFAPLLRRAGRWWPAALGVVTGLAQLVLPLRDEIKFGQVDELLAVLCVVDVVLLRRRKWSGVLVGIATAVKLTPAVFIVYLLVRGRYRAAALAAGTFVACSLLAAGISPGNSRRFWTDVVFHTERLRSNAGTSNQSLRGMWLRALPGHGPLVTVLWLLTAGVVAVVGLRRARRASTAGDEVAAVALVGMVALLVSPVSWIHHFVWVVLAIAVVIGVGDDPRRWLLGAALYAFFALPLPWWGSHAAASGTLVPLGRLAQDAFGLMTVVLLVSLRPRTPDSGSGAVPTSVAKPITVRHNGAVHLGGDQ